MGKCTKSRRTFLNFGKSGLVSDFIGVSSSLAVGTTIMRDNFYLMKTEELKSHYNPQSIILTLNYTKYLLKINIYCYNKMV